MYYTETNKKAAYKQSIKQYLDEYIVNNAKSK